MNLSRSLLFLMLALSTYVSGLTVLRAQEDQPSKTPKTETPRIATVEVNPDETPTPPKPPAKLVRLTVRGAVFDSTPPLGLFGGSMGNSLGDLQNAIRDAAEDDRVGGLILDLRSPAIAWTQTQALRRAILSYRESGKPAHCHLTTAGNTAFVLASACSDVSLLPTGALELPGLSMSRMYLKGLFDKVGVEFQELRMGRYKSAAEGYTREGPSDAVREESHALLDELYSEFVDALAENLDKSPIVVRSLIDQSLFLPEDALAAGLVDHVEYEDEFYARIQKSGDQERQITNARLGKKLNLQTGGFAGMMALMNELFGGPRRTIASKNPKIAILYASGAIVQSAGGQGMLLGGEVMTSDQMVKLLRQVRKDDTVKALVLRVNSPGGSALASDLIWREVSLTRKVKPVVVSMGSMAASGGYYISCGANWIVSERGTLTGSIGVIGVIPNLRKIHELAGVRYETFSRGKRSQSITPYGELTEDGREMTMAFMRKIYDDFLERVAEGRKLPKKAVHAIAEGRVWTGGQALKHGLVDELGGLEVAIAKARELGNVPDDAEILKLPKAKTLFEVLQDLEGVQASIPSTWISAAAMQSLPDALKPLLRHISWIQRAKGERALTVLPEILTIR